MLSALKGRLRALIAPHEPSPVHVQALQTRLRNAGLHYALYSQLSSDSHLSPGASETKKIRKEDEAIALDVVIIDEVGVLADLYPIGDLAFVGGSFRKTVHSVMEPLAAGCLTFVGPFHSNNREALEFMEIPIEDSSMPGKDEPLMCVTAVRNEAVWIERLRVTLSKLSNLSTLRTFSTLSTLSTLSTQGAPEPSELDRWRERLQGQVQRRAGRSRLVADWVFTHRLP